ncbi:MAG: hypothetical protein KKB51_23710 [Candidatus Riflebacteria bacterium]|nr:hypothetical protein [Candidatus Riflebacteria bacterium]
MGIIDMKVEANDELDNDALDNEPVIEEIEEDLIEDTDGDTADEIEDEFADLFPDDGEALEDDELEDEQPAAETAAVTTAEPEKDKPAPKDLTPADSFSPGMTPGTKEYLERIASESEEIVKKLFGAEEYDPFDSKHIAAFNRVSRKLDEQAEKFYDDKQQEVKQQETVAAALDVAEQNIGQILSSPELEAKFDAAVRSLPVSKYFEMKAKARKGDYTSFINLANKVAGLRAKVEQVNNREQPAPRQTQARDDETVQRGAGSVADFLGI